MFPERVRVYTAIAGDFPFTRSDIQCFGNAEIFQRPVMEAKRYKILPHLFFPDNDATLWVDANIWPRLKPEAMLAAFLPPEVDLTLFAHPYRKTVWEEFATLKQDRRFAIPYLQQQLAEQEKQYRKEGLPEETPLYECSVLARRNDAVVNELMESWWAQICRWQWRDQVSLPYVLRKYRQRLVIKVINVNVREHGLFRYVSQHG